MTKCEDIYCRLEARKRLKEDGYDEKQAREISQKAFDYIKEAIEDSPKK